ncbi:MAG: (Fe-S)-binding protein [Actinobacteria bacterium]|nr:(Fe-S)-binding protein [Actinomycetota bacterium]
MTLSLEMLMYTCVRCKICTANLHPGEEEFLKLCPAFTRYGYFTYSGGGKCYLAQGLLEEAIEPDEDMAEVLYHCTLCKTCAEQCSTDQDPTAIAREVRNEFVRRTGGPPGDGQVIVKSTVNYRNPYQQPKAMRYRWAKGIDIKDAAKEKVDTLYYVGCTAAMIPERTHFALNTVKLLDAAGESFGTLGRKEVCCGSTSYNLGGQDAFRKVASENIDMINGLGASRVVTSCAGCYSIMKNEYPKLKRLNFEVFHFVEYLDELQRDGKLEPTKKLDLKVTYHDPCHLGRYCELYDAPRRIIEALPGVELVEMPRNREKSWCCGAGAGVKTIYPDFALWTSEERIKEARETGAETLVTACPFCEGNLADGITAAGSEMDLYDITDLVLMALE